MPIDYKDYHPQWKKISSFVRRVRARSKCEACELANYSVIRRNENGEIQRVAGNLYLDTVGWYGAAKYSEAREIAEHWNQNELDTDGWGKWIVIVLTVAHLDHDINNNELDNLSALCQSCHNKHDIEHRAKNRKLTVKEKKHKGQLKIF